MSRTPHDRAEQEFWPGDLVILRSGGPTMTVEKVEDEGEERVCCVWFCDDGNHTLRHEAFPAACLEMS